jgi:L-seryl-tRNA(Ser) seleniumtransferase
VIDALWEQNPRIVVHLSGNAVALNPQTLEPGEDRIVLKAIQRVLASEPGA